MTDIENSFIDYGKLIDDAMHQIVINALNIVSKKGLSGGHHFFISFNTRHEGVSLSPNLLSKYPSEMTIVLQHQFEDLIISDDKFEVTLSFNRIKEKIVIPFKSLIAFADPSVKFGLQFKKFDDLLDDESDSNDFSIDRINADTSIKQSNEEDSKTTITNKDNVVSVDFTRK